MAPPTNEQLIGGIRRGLAIPRHALTMLAPRAPHEGFCEADLRQEFAEWVAHHGRRREPWGTWEAAWNDLVATSDGVWRLTQPKCQRCMGKPYSHLDVAHGGVCRSCRGTRQGRTVSITIRSVPEGHGPDPHAPDQHGQEHDAGDYQARPLSGS